MADNDCTFCREIVERRNAAIVYEDSDTIAFLDYAPVETGHVLVVPKKHYKNIFDISEDSYVKVHKVARKIAPAICRAVNADAMNIGQNNGTCANQVVMHYHLHLIPRFCISNSEAGQVSEKGMFAKKPLNWNRRITDRDELEAVAIRIRQEIERQ